MTSDKKRKRSSNAEDETEQPPVKAQIVEEERNGSNAAKADGDRRQKKSERKKKRDVQVKQKPEKDSLADGRDYVPLAGYKQPKKNKGRSPRSIRKEARQKKVDSQPKETKQPQNGEEQPQNGEQSQDGEQDSGANARFICFVGNLPYTVTTEQIAAHFSSLQPKAIRLSTDKNTGKCKGFAFLEFENYDKMKTCLKLYHHSIFDPEGKGRSGEDAGQDQNSKSRGRKINVELTAGGGGGKSAGRRDKIKAKNKKLDEERARDWEKKKIEEAEKSKGQQGRKNDKFLSGANADAEDHVASDRGDIHPSRLSRVRG